MANPQAENGHIDIANELAEAFARIRLSGEEVQCLWVILRKTYGWHKKEDKISLTQFTKMTGLKRSNVCRALKKLLSKKIIDVIKNDTTNQVNTYKIIKNYDLWKPVSKKIPSIKNDTIAVIKNDNTLVSKKIHTKENTTKENNTKENNIYLPYQTEHSGLKEEEDILAKTFNNAKILYPSEVPSNLRLSKDQLEKLTDLFLRLWSIYPRKVGKKAAWRAWLKIKPLPDEALLQKMIAKIKEQKQSLQWQQDNGRYIPHPSTWLNQARWEDETEILLPISADDEEWINKLVSIYNSKAYRMHKVSFLTDERKRKLLEIKRKYSDLKWWAKVFEIADRVKIKRSDGSKWTPNFDWLIESEDNAVGIYEGKYGGLSEW